MLVPGWKITLRNNEKDIKILFENSPPEQILLFMKEVKLFNKITGRHITE